MVKSFQDFSPMYIFLSEIFDTDQNYLKQNTTKSVKTSTLLKCFSCFQPMLKKYDCLPNEQLCDGRAQCRFGEDEFEANCRKYLTPYNFRLKISRDLFKPCVNSVFFANINWNKYPPQFVYKLCTSIYHVVYMCMVFPSIAWYRFFCAIEN